MSRSFTTRLVIPVALVSAAVVTLGLFTDYRVSRDRIVEELEDDARSSISGAVLRLQELTTGLEALVRFLGEAIDDAPDETLIDQVLNGVLDSNPHIFAAAIALNPDSAPGTRGLAPYLYRDKGGLSRTDLAKAGSPYWQEPWFTNARDTGDPAWVDPYFEPTGAMTELTTFSAPLYRGKGNGRAFLGVATIDLRLSDLHEYLDDLRIDGRGFGFLLTRQGILIGAPSGTVISGPIGEILQSAEIDEWQAWLNSGKSATVLCPDSDDECQLRIGTMGDSKWSVGVIYSEESLLQPLRNYALRALALGAAMLSLIVILVSALAKRLTAPLVALAHASRSIARGELDVPLPKAEGDDEVAQLVGAFHRMRQDLSLIHISEPTRPY